MMARVRTGCEMRNVVAKVNLGIAGLDGGRINRHPFIFFGFEPDNLGLA